MIQRLPTTAVRIASRHASLLRRATPSVAVSLAALATQRVAQARAFSSTRSYSSFSGKPSSGSTTTLGSSYARDDYTNVPSSILSRLHSSPVLPYRPSHPLTLLRAQIESHLRDTHTALSAPSPIVSVETNFGMLGFPPDHPGRAPSDTYYLNRSTCLRTHTSAHEVDVFKAGHTHWLLTADVYRRDEVDASHYPVFHQMEGAAIWGPEDFGHGGRVQRECEQMEASLAGAQVQIEDNVDIHEAGGWQTCHASTPETQRAAELSARHLKATLNGLVLALFGPRHAADLKAAASGEQEPLCVRWISASFPFTSPSFEVEVWFRGKWLEILGCGVVKQNTLDNAGIEGKVGWAFGLGLERIAMVLFSIPDIRLFWSQDARFISQFSTPPGTSSSGVSASGGLQSPSSSSAAAAAAAPLVTFKPYSKFPPCLKDVSFWLPSSAAGDGKQTFHENDFCEVVRDEAQDLAEDVRLIDEFTHPKTGRTSRCYRINYRSMDRNLEHEEINALHAKITQRLVEELGIEPR